jgi:lysophospholipase L1-like esterase
MVRKSLFPLLTPFFFLFSSVGLAQDIVPSHIVCAVGDSHVEDGSFLITALGRELGEDYEVRAEGRRSWTSSRWIRTGDFASVCEGADIVLVSLGGNDRRHGRSWRAIKENVDVLISTLPTGVHVWHMPVPRYHRPRVPLAPDGVHLTRGGATIYARMIAPHLRVAD